MFFHLGQPGGEEFAQIQIGTGVGALGFSNPQFEQLHAARDQRGHFDLNRRAWGRGFGGEGLAEGGEHGGVNGIGLGELTGGAGELPDACGIDDTDRLGGGVQRGDDGAFVAAGGFTDEVDAGDGRQAFDQLSMALGGVGQIKEFALEVELEGGLGDVQTGMDGCFFVIHNCGCVLTHSCGYELAWLRRRSGNGSSSGRKSADGSGGASDSKGPRVERSHPRRRPSACRPRDGSSSRLADAKQGRLKTTYKGCEEQATLGVGHEGLIPHRRATTPLGLLASDRFSQGGSFLATLGFTPESPWDSSLELPKGITTRLQSW